MDFCNNNDLELIVRAHECVMDGFERFAQGHLITLFSATNYCGTLSLRDLHSQNWSWGYANSLVFLNFLDLSTGTANNAGAILVLGRDLVVVPKLIHPLPPASSFPEASAECQTEDTWMQVLLLVFVTYIEKLLFSKYRLVFY